MPKEGYKSITVREDIYDHFMSIYIENKERLFLLGVNSLSGLVVFLLESSVKEGVIEMQVRDRINKLLSTTRVSS